MNTSCVRRRLLRCAIVWGVCLTGASAEAPLDRWFALPDHEKEVTAEISGAAASSLLDDQVVLVSDEDRARLYTYDFRLRRIETVLFAKDPTQEINDLEMLTLRPDGRYFMMGSLSRNSSCQERDNRVRFAGFELSEDAEGQMVVENYEVRGSTAASLRSAILERLPPGPLREAAQWNRPKEGGLDVEALAVLPPEATPFQQEALFLGLRGPLSEPPLPDTPGCEPGRRPGSGVALYFYLLNPDAYLRGTEDSKLLGPYKLPLGGQGIREVVLLGGDAPTRPPRLLVVSGSVGDGGHPHLWLVDPRHPQAPPVPVRPVPGSDFLPIEGVAVVNVKGAERLTLYTDNGSDVPSDAIVTAIPAEGR